MEETIAAIVGALISGVITWYFTKGDLAQKNTRLEREIQQEVERRKQEVERRTNTERDLKAYKNKVSELQVIERKYNDVKQKLERSSMVYNYHQPVLLVGPRAVGKTSLVMQWHAPWDHSIVDPTQTKRTSIVPIYDYKLLDTHPHFADDSIRTNVHVHLRLRVFDFPGELQAQKSIKEDVIQETQKVRQETQKDIGIVLICMFDSQEVVQGRISNKTIDYYNGELFANLRSIVSHQQAHVERLILVFNKYDLLKKSHNKKDSALLQDCIHTFEPVIQLLRGICNSDRVCEVITILSREDIVLNNRGAPIVLGEAARGFVEKMAGREAAKSVLKGEASTHAASLF